MQKRSSMLVDFSRFVDKIVDTFEYLKAHDGKQLETFLENTKCGDDVNVEPVRNCTYDDYVQSMQL